MAQFIVTVKLTPDPNHNPKNKMYGICPLTGDACTDTTGAHHSELVANFAHIAEVMAHYESLGYHVTRVERVYGS